MKNYEDMTREELLCALRAGEKRKKSRDKLKRTVQELQIYQIELEMQNRELKETREELEASHERYTDLYDFAPAGYLTHDKRGVIQKINLTGSKLLSADRKELVGMPFKMYVAPQNTTAFLNHLLRCEQTGSPTTSELRLKQQGEKEIDVQLLTVPFYNREKDITLYRTVLTDITERKTIENKLNKYRNHLEAIFQSVDEGIITVNRDFRIINMNRAAENICSPDGEFHKKHFKNVIKSCNTNKCFKALQSAVKNKKSAELYRMECPGRNSPRQVVTINITPLIGKGDDLQGAVMVIKDETGLLEMEEKLKEQSRFHNITGKSPAMQKIFYFLKKLSSVSTTVLITGESGTGKELAAEALHYKGPRKDKPLIKVNCSALPSNLLESELFGHKKGAFTGAFKDKPGRFQIANGGTIFLDEIGDISPALQLSLLRVLEEKEFEQLGDNRSIKVDVRIITSTNQDLQRKVQLGKFREDLYYRLKVMEIKLPPLRERIEDIPLLTEHFIKKFNRKLDRYVKSLSKDVEKVYFEYPWPGNIRELEHSLEHAFVVSSRPVITLDDLPDDLKNFAETKSTVSYKIDNERDLISKALKKTDWKKAKAASLLGINRKTLYNKIKKYGISKES